MARRAPSKQTRESSPRARLTRPRPGPVPLVLLLGLLLHWAGARRSYTRRSPVEPGDVSWFDGHFFVPCRDEEAVVGTTVTRLRTDFPASHVWVIDDDRDDRTGAIVTELAADDPRVHLVARRRPNAGTGKGAASTPRTTASGRSFRRAPTVPA
ncbi:glycosyltransferase [Streptomyces sp. NPDC056061]|uniref:glycosyltransferase n=1 Tax=Streptomyces sp. NPDC056061 TaxID=3345700 RepID=UPI0035E30405